MDRRTGHFKGSSVASVARARSPRLQPSSMGPQALITGRLCPVTKEWRAMVSQDYSLRDMRTGGEE